jgi:Putative zinc-finger
MRASLGAAALGRAEPAELLALRAHLDGCPECRAELRELTSVAGALPLADPSRIADDLTPPPTALATLVLGRVAAERAARRKRARRRIAVAAATATAVAAAAIAFLLVVPGDAPSGTKVVFASSASSEITGTATLHARAAGTEVAFHGAGLDAGDYYWLWLTGDDGRRVAAGTIRGTGEPVDAVMTAALPLGKTRRIWVTDAHDRVVLDQHLPAPA